MYKNTSTPDGSIISRVIKYSTPLSCFKLKIKHGQYSETFNALIFFVRISTKWKVYIWNLRGDGRRY